MFALETESESTCFLLVPLHLVRNSLYLRCAPAQCAAPSPVGAVDWPTGALEGPLAPAVATCDLDGLRG